MRSSREIFVWMIITLNFSILVTQENDKSIISSIEEHYKIENIKNFQSKILNVKFAEETGEYVVVTEGTESNSLEFYNSDHSLMWQKDIGNNSNFNISENGNTITAYRNSMLEVYDKNGDLLFTKNSYETGYFLSPNGEYLIDYEGDSPRKFYYFNRNGEKIEPELPDRFDAPLFYLRFTPDNKILALFVGQKSDKPFSKEKKNRWRKGSKTIKYKPLPDIEIGSYLMQFNPEFDELKWVIKLTDNLMLLPTFHTLGCTISDSNIVLYGRGKNKNDSGLYCIRRNGELLHYISEINILENPRIISIAINEYNQIGIQGRFGESCILNFNTGNIETKFNITRSDQRRGSNYRINSFIGNILLFQPMNKLNNNTVVEIINNTPTISFSDHGYMLTEKTISRIENDYRTLYQWKLK